MKKIAFKIYFDVEVNGKMAGVSHVKKVLTKALKNITLRRQALAIDAASVYLEMNDYANAEIVLRKNGLETEANAVGRLK